MEHFLERSIEALQKKMQDTVQPQLSTTGTSTDSSSSGSVGCAVGKTMVVIENNPSSAGVPNVNAQQVQGPDDSATSQRVSDTSKGTDSSFKSDPELMELETMRKTLESRIQLCRSKSGRPALNPTACESEYTDIMHKSKEHCLSMQNNPPSLKTISLPGAETQQCAAAARVMVELKDSDPKPGCSHAAEEAPPDAKSRGENNQCKDWFARQMMKTLHDMDAEDCIFQHLETKILESIAKDEYVDFNKLIDREDDEQGTQVNEPEGVTFYIPQTKVPFKISNFATWCKAALIYMGAHQKFHLDRAAELIEYRSSIEGFAKTYPWFKVAEYDRKFRRNQAKKPWHHWELISQTLVMRVLNSDEEGKEKPNKKQEKGEQQSGQKGKGKRGICRRWNNSGKCRWNDECYYEHKCAICGKMSHGAIACPWI